MRKNEATIRAEVQAGIAGTSQDSTSSLYRYTWDHIPGALVRAHKVQEVARADGLLEQDSWCGLPL